MSEIVDIALDDKHGTTIDVQKMREARNSPAVHKLTLATIRANSSQCLVFVCEGVDDKKVYFHWLRSINPALDYEFQVCNGKGFLLEFRKLLQRDISGLDRKVYFFVDRDFDGLRGYPLGQDIYISDFYSFENWLVTKEVLDNILCIELHCHGERQARESVLATFEMVYSSFLKVTKPHNERIFLARHLGINTKPFPKSVGKLAHVTLTDVQPHQENSVIVIKLEREPTELEIEEKIDKFGEIVPHEGYRGKFALLFFLRWIELLGNDRNSDNPVLFKLVRKSAANANGQLSLDSVAAKSLPPLPFRRFIEAIPDAREASFLEVKPVSG